MAYSLIDFTVTLNGIPVYGFINGTNAFDWEWNNVQNEMYVGADGYTSVYKHVDYSGKVMLRLQFASPLNQIIEALAGGEQTLKQTVQTNISITNVKTGFYLSGSYGAFGQRAGGEMGSGITTREWEFLMADMKVISGVGDTPVDSSSLQKVTSILANTTGFLGGVNALGNLV